MTSMSEAEALRILQPGKPERLGVLCQIDPDSIDPNELNPRIRFPADEEEQLSKSIKQQGILVPLIVYERQKERYALLDGERRLRCARKLGLQKVPAHVLPMPPDQLENLRRLGRCRR
jgi:ParB family chromosome partitioning protein